MFEVRVSLTKLIFRAQYQDTLVLGHEKLWWGSQRFTAVFSQHPQPLYGNIIACHCTPKLFVQGDHSQCHTSSSCQLAGYIPSRARITNTKAQEELLRCIKATYVYKHADAFCRVMI